MNDSTPPEGKRRFKETRALVRLALDDGMTQTEIARICRTQQSTVSMWANGERKAFEHQVEPLLARYGRQLRRSSERVYLVEGPAEAWEGSEWAQMFAEARPQYEGLQQSARVRLLERLAEQTGGTLGLVLADKKGRWFDSGHQDYQVAGGARHWEPHTTSTLPDAAFERLEAAAKEAYLAMRRSTVAVEGSLLFRHVVFRPFVASTRAGERLSGEPKQRWLVHAPSPTTFVLVRQSRLQLPVLLRALWHRQAGLEIQYKEGPVPTDVIRNCVHSPDDDARWLSEIEGPMDLEALLARADRFAAAPDGFATVHDQLTLPFRLRKALIEHGYPVPGLRRICAS